MLSREIVWLDPKSIVVKLEDRQRQLELDVGDLIPSVKEKGVMLPILVVQGTLELVAGFRRLTAALSCEKTEVPVRFVDEGTSAFQLLSIEWEENAKRRDLTWQDNAKAQWKMHSMLLAVADAKGIPWSIERSAVVLKQSEKHTYKMLDLGEALAEGDEALAKADTVANATTILTRRRERAKGEALNRILEIDNDDDDELALDTDETAGGTSSGVLGAVVGDRSTTETQAGNHAGISGASNRLDGLPRAERAPPYVITNADAHAFLAGYEGPKFNFLHCDLPYGVALNGQAGQSGFEGGGYESSPDIYWALMRSIAKHWDKFMYPSSHVMFWISMKFYTETVEFFSDCAANPGKGESAWTIPSDLRVNPTPLIWHKTDNKGIIADHLRGPRNIYEAALIMSTGDRHLVRPTSNVYGCPTAKGAEAIHTNEKPDPMLRYFFQMFVDEHSRVLDPTCGSGSSIRVAESLGAEAALGLEFNPEFADRAQRKLVSARGLAKLSSVVNEAAGEAGASVLDNLDLEL